MTATDLRDTQNRDLIVDEGESLNLEVTFKDFDGAEIDANNLATITLTLYDEDTLTVINSRLDQNVKGANGGTIDADNHLIMRLDGSDNVLVASAPSAGDQEDHVALFKWTWNDGTQVRTGKDRRIFKVEKLPTPINP